MNTLLLFLAVGATLDVDVQGFTHARGHAIAKLFVPGEDVTKHGHAEAKADIVDGHAIFRFDELVPGDYAVVVFHDENDNGIIDHGVLGPREPIAFSGGFRLGLFSGMPTFEKLRFTVPPAGTRLALRVR